MALFTVLYDENLSMHYQEVPMRKKDTDRWSTEHFKFCVSFNYNDKTLDTTYYVSGVPNAQDIFACIVIDARSVYDKNFLDFCLNHGYDTDSMKAFKLFKACKKQYKKLLNFLGEELFQQFMECEIDW